MKFIHKRHNLDACHKTLVRRLLFVVLPVFIVGCVSTGDRSGYQSISEVDRRFQSEGVDANDYNIVVTRMVESLLNREFLRDLGGNRPMVVLGNIFNDTPFEITEEMLLNKLVVEMNRPGSPIRFSAASSEVRSGGHSGSLYAQLQFQNESGMVDPDTISQVGHLIGANYVLYGFVANIETRSSDASQAYFSFIMMMHSVETGQIVWSEEAEVVKVIASDGRVEPSWWRNASAGTSTLIYKTGSSERARTEAEARAKAYEAGLAEFRRSITTDTNFWSHIHFSGTDIPYAQAHRDDRGRWYTWVIVSYPRTQFDLALQRAQKRAAEANRRIPVFVAPLAFGRESQEQFPEVVERYREQGYGNAVWQTIENLLYDRGFDVITAPASQTRDMLQDILGQFAAEASSATKLPEKLLLINMNYFEIKTESLSRGRLTRKTDFHVALMLEMYEVSAEFGNVKIPAHGEARDENLLAATRRSAETAVNQLVERLRNR
jgi:penicillin-binding protein activator